MPLLEWYCPEDPWRALPVPPVMEGTEEVQVLAKLPGGALLVRSGGSVVVSDEGARLHLLAWAEDAARREVPPRAAPHALAAAIERTMPTALGAFHAFEQEALAAVALRYGPWLSSRTYWARGRWCRELEFAFGDGP